MPINQLDDYADLDALQARIDTLFESYRHSLYDDRRWVFDHLRYQDAARRWWAWLGGPARVDVGVDRA